MSTKTEEIKEEIKEQPKKEKAPKEEKKDTKKKKKIRIGKTNEDTMYRNRNNGVNNKRQSEFSNR